jgi:microcystin-dependent protein
MSEPFLSEIRIVSFNYPPKGWTTCDGQLLPINQNQALFSLLGTTYGGNGQTTFQLPNLKGRLPMGVGTGYFLGQFGGAESHPLNLNELPPHIHTLAASTATGRSASPGGNVLAAARGAYGETPDTTLHPNTLGNFGSSGQPHENRPPFLALNFVIALTGIFPSQN